MLVIVKKNGQLSEIVKFVFSMLVDSKKADTYQTSGKGRFTHYVRTEAGKVLDAKAFEYFGIRYKVCNDSIRGGKLGEYILIDEKAREKIELILKAFE